jgi:hypothetical protein
MNREMKAHNDSIARRVPTYWSFGGDRFSSAHDHETYGLFRTWGNFAIARRIHSYLVEIITGPGTGNLYHSAVTGGKVNAQGHLLAIQQHGHAGRKHENGDRIYPRRTNKTFTLHLRPSRTYATCLSAIQTRTVNYHSRYKNRLIGCTVRASSPTKRLRPSSAGLYGHGSQPDLVAATKTWPSCSRAMCSTASTSPPGSLTAANSLYRASILRSGVAFRNAHHDGDNRRGAGMLDRAPFTAVQSSGFPSTDPFYKGCLTVRSKLLQRVSCNLHQLREVVDGQQNTEDSSVQWRKRENPPGRVSPPVETRHHKDSPGLLRYDGRRQYRLR